MEIGCWDQIRPYEFEHFGGTAAVLEQHIDLAKLLDQLGFDNYWTIEHQSSYVGAVTSPSVWLAALARETRSIRLGAMIWIVPLHDPMRLAEEVAMLDQLSGGRVEFGAGIGIHEHEFLRWNRDFSTRQAMGEEAIEIIQQAWANETVTFQGEFWNYDEAFPIPHPYQQPHPPIWAAVHSERSIEWAARHNFHMAMNIDPDDVLAEKFRLFRTLWTGFGHDGPMPRQFLMRHVYVAETDEQAVEEAKPHLLQAWRLGREMITNSRIGMGSNERGVGQEDSPSVLSGAGSSWNARDFDFWLETGLAHVGSPQTVARRILRSQEAMGFTQFAGNFHIGAMGPQQVERSVRLFGEQVIPALRMAAATPPGVEPDGDDVGDAAGLLAL